MLANPLEKYAVMIPILDPSTHPIQPNTVETMRAGRFFKKRPPFVRVLPRHRTLPTASSVHWCHRDALDSMTGKCFGYKAAPFHLFDVVTEKGGSFRSPTFGQSDGLSNDHESPRQQSQPRVSSSAVF